MGRFIHAIACFKVVRVNTIMPKSAFMDLVLCVSSYFFIIFQIVELLLMVILSK